MLTLPKKIQSLIPASATCDKEYTPDEMEFMKALDQYKRQNNRPWPTCCEVLAVLKGLGYKKRS